ncbi:MAG: T9SS type A sorting domain-containing protein [Saprospiraceae bacterium]
MKRYLVSSLCFLFSLNVVIAQQCIDTVSNSLTLLSKKPESGNDCSFSVQFCVRKTSAEADHILYSVNYSYGTLYRTIYIPNVPVGTIICQTFDFIANCDSKAQFHAHGKTVSHVLCGAVQDMVVLPIRLLSFTAEQDKIGTVHLKWLTASESNVSHFVIQQSKDGKFFNDIAKLKATGDSKILKSYSHEVKTSGIGTGNSTIYFRLKSVDRDETFNYSQIIYIGKKEKNKIEIYPNPSSHVLNLGFDFLEGDQLSMTTIHGQKVPLHWLDEKTLDIQELQNGIYFLIYQNDVIKFLKN